MHMIEGNKVLSQLASSVSREDIDNLLETGLRALEKKKIADKYDESGQYDIALKWYRIAASLGNEEAIYKIGCYYENGYSVIKSKEKAYAFYKKGAEHGQKDCLRKMAPEYYCGSAFCERDITKAKQYWIRLFIKEPSQSNEVFLNKFFQGWKKENTSVFSELKYKSRDILEKLAHYGISSAMYWLGVNEYGSGLSAELKKILGFTLDENIARRWLLQAALDDFSLAGNALMTLFQIDIGNASTGDEMLNNSYKYSNASTEEEKDLRFFWLRKAVNAGCEAACNNLGVCYDGAIGTERDYKTANELYQRAIKYNGNEAAYYNYGLNIYYGNGVSGDEHEAKNYLLISRSKGLSAAASFLKEHYEIDKGLGIDYSDGENDEVIFDGDEVYIVYRGINTTESSFKLRFWCSNSSPINYDLWIKTISVNNAVLEEYAKCGTMVPGTCYLEVSLPHLLSLEDIVEFRVEIDDAEDNELCTINKCRITFDKETITPQFELLGNLLHISLNKYAFAYDNFENIPIFEQGSRHIAFGGFKVEDETVFLKIWMLNESGYTYQTFLRELRVDGELIYGNKFIKIVTSDKKWKSASIPIKCVDLFSDFEIEFDVVVMAMNEYVFGLSQHIKVNINFADKILDVSMQSQEEQDDIRLYNSDTNEYYNATPYVPQSFCGYDYPHEVCIDPEQIASVSRSGWKTVFNGYDDDLTDYYNNSLMSISGVRESVRKALKYI